MKLFLTILKKHFRFNLITLNILIGLISSIINFWNGQYNLGLAWLFGAIGWFIAELNELIIKAESSLCDEFENNCIKYSKLLEECNDELKSYKEEYFKDENKD
jgi:hypothetical protein